VCPRLRGNEIDERGREVLGLGSAITRKARGACCPHLSSRVRIIDWAIMKRAHSILAGYRSLKAQKIRTITGLLYPEPYPEVPEKGRIGSCRRPAFRSIRGFSGTA
jgi:hypothetical protein